MWQGGDADGAWSSGLSFFSSFHVFFGCAAHWGLLLTSVRPKEGWFNSQEAVGLAARPASGERVGLSSSRELPFHRCAQAGRNAVIFD